MISYYCLYRLSSNLIASEEENSLDGIGMNDSSDAISVEELKNEVEDLKVLVNTLLTVIMEEADGVQSGAAPTIPNQPKRGYCM